MGTGNDYKGVDTYIDNRDNQREAILVVKDKDVTVDGDDLNKTAVMEVDGAGLDFLADDGEYKPPAGGTPSVRVNQLTGTGLVDGGLLTINGGDDSTFDLSAGTGFIVNNYTAPDAPTVLTVPFAGGTGLTVPDLASAPVSRVLIDSNGDVVVITDELTDDDYRDFIVIGSLVHQNQTNITNAVMTPFVALGMFQIVQFISLFGAQNITGNEFTANGSNLTIDKAEGTSWRLGANYALDNKNPNIEDIPSAAALTFLGVYSAASGTELNIIPASTLIDPLVYDDGSGVLNVFGGSGNQATLRHIYFFPASNITVIRIGTFVYSTIDDAVAFADAEIPFVTSDFRRQGYVRTVLAVTKNAVDLSNLSQAVFVQENSVKLS